MAFRKATASRKSSRDVQVNFRITSVKDQEGNASFTVLSVAEDIERRRHRRDPFLPKYVQFCLGDFEAVLDDEARAAAGGVASDMDRKRIAVDYASKNVQVRLQIIKSMKDNLVKTTGEAIKVSRSAPLAAADKATDAAGDGDGPPAASKKKKGKGSSNPDATAAKEAELAAATRCLPLVDPLLVRQLRGIRGAPGEDVGRAGAPPGAGFQGSRRDASVADSASADGDASFPWLLDKLGDPDSFASKDIHTHNVAQAATWATDEGGDSVLPQSTMDGPRSWDELMERLYPESFSHDRWSHISGLSAAVIPDKLAGAGKEQQCGASKQPACDAAHEQLAFPGMGQRSESADSPMVSDEVLRHIWASRTTIKPIQEDDVVLGGERGLLGPCPVDDSGRAASPSGWSPSEDEEEGERGEEGEEDVPGSSTRKASYVRRGGKPGSDNDMLEPGELNEWPGQSNGTKGWAGVDGGGRAMEEGRVVEGGSFAGSTAHKEENGEGKVTGRGHHNEGNKLDSRSHGHGCGITVDGTVVDASLGGNEDLSGYPLDFPGSDDDGNGGDDNDYTEEGDGRAVGASGKGEVRIDASGPQDVQGGRPAATPRGENHPSAASANGDVGATQEGPPAPAKGSKAAQEPSSIHSLSDSDSDSDVFELNCYKPRARPLPGPGASQAAVGASQDGLPGSSAREQRCRQREQQRQELLLMEQEQEEEAGGKGGRAGTHGGSRFNSVREEWREPEVEEGREEGSKNGDEDPIEACNARPSKGSGSLSGNASISHSQAAGKTKAPATVSLGGLRPTGKELGLLIDLRKHKDRSALYPARLAAASFSGKCRVRAVKDAEELLLAPYPISGIGSLDDLDNVFADEGDDDAIEDPDAAARDEIDQLDEDVGGAAASNPDLAPFGVLSAAWLKGGRWGDPGGKKLAASLRSIWRPPGITECTAEVLKKSLVTGSLDITERRRFLQQCWEEERRALRPQTQRRMATEAHAPGTREANAPGQTEEHAPGVAEECADLAHEAHQADVGGEPLGRTAMRDEPDAVAEAAGSQRRSTPPTPAAAAAAVAAAEQERVGCKAGNESSLDVGLGTQDAPRSENPPAGHTSIHLPAEDPREMMGWEDEGRDLQADVGALPREGLINSEGRGQLGSIPMGRESLDSCWGFNSPGAASVGNRTSLQALERESFCPPRVVVGKRGGQLSHDGRDADDGAGRDSWDVGGRASLGRGAMSSIPPSHRQDQPGHPPYHQAHCQAAQGWSKQSLVEGGEPRMGDGDYRMEDGGVGVDGVDVFVTDAGLGERLGTSARGQGCGKSWGLEGGLMPSSIRVACVPRDTEGPDSRIRQASDDQHHDEGEGGYRTDVNPAVCGDYGDATDGGRYGWGEDEGRDIWSPCWGSDDQPPHGNTWTPGAQRGSCGNSAEWRGGKRAGDFEPMESNGSPMEDDVVGGCQDFHPREPACRAGSPQQSKQDLQPASNYISIGNTGISGREGEVGLQREAWHLEDEGMITDSNAGTGTSAGPGTGGGTGIGTGGGGPALHAASLPGAVPNTTRSPWPYSCQLPPRPPHKPTLSSVMPQGSCAMLADAGGRSGTGRHQEDDHGALEAGDKPWRDAPEAVRKPSWPGDVQRDRDGARSAFVKEQHGEDFFEEDEEDEEEKEEEEEEVLDLAWLPGGALGGMSALGGNQSSGNTGGASLPSPQVPVLQPMTNHVDDPSRGNTEMPSISSTQLHQPPGLPAPPDYGRGRAAQVESSTTRGFSDGTDEIEVEEGGQGPWRVARPRLSGSSGQSHGPPWGVNKPSCAGDADDGVEASLHDGASGRPHAGACSSPPLSHQRPDVGSTHPCGGPNLPEDERPDGDLRDPLTVPLNGALLSTSRTLDEQASAGITADAMVTDGRRMPADGQVAGVEELVLDASAPSSGPQMDGRARGGRVGPRESEMGEGAMSSEGGMCGGAARGLITEGAEAKGQEGREEEELPASPTGGAGPGRGSHRFRESYGSQFDGSQQPPREYQNRASLTSGQALLMELVEKERAEREQWGFGGGGDGASSGGGGKMAPLSASIARAIAGEYGLLDAKGKIVTAASWRKRVANSGDGGNGRPINSKRRDGKFYPGVEIDGDDVCEGAAQLGGKDGKGGGKGVNPELLSGLTLGVVRSRCIQASGDRVSMQRYFVALLHLAHRVNIRDTELDCNLSEAGYQMEIVGGPAEKVEIRLHPCVV